MTLFPVILTPCSPNCGETSKLLTMQVVHTWLVVIKSSNILITQGPWRRLWRYIDKYIKIEPQKHHTIFDVFLWFVSASVLLLSDLCPAGSSEGSRSYHSLEHSVLETSAESCLPHADGHTDGLLTWRQVLTGGFQRSNLVIVEEAGCEFTWVR